MIQRSRLSKLCQMFIQSNWADSGGVCAATAMNRSCFPVVHGSSPGRVGWLAESRLVHCSRSSPGTVAHSVERTHIHPRGSYVSSSARSSVRSSWLLPLCSSGRFSRPARSTLRCPLFDKKKGIWRTDRFPFKFEVIYM